MTVLTYVRAGLAVLEALIAGGGDVAGLLAEMEKALGQMQAENRDPTLAEWQALNGKIKAALDLLS